MYVNDLTYDSTMFCDFFNLLFYIVVIKKIFTVIIFEDENFFKEGRM